MGLPHGEPRRSFSYKETFRQLIRPLARVLSSIRVRPDTLTIAGWVLSVCAATLFALGYTKTAGAVMLFAGLFDALDGAVARESNLMSSFGAFLDSTLDRLAEGAILGALGVVMAQDGRDWVVAACFAALTGSFVVSYARARAEGLAIAGSSGGLMGRPERLVIVGAALFLGGLGEITEVLIAVLAVLSLITAFHRILIVYRASDAREDRERARERRHGGDRRRGAGR